MLVRSYTEPKKYELNGNSIYKNKNVQKQSDGDNNQYFEYEQEEVSLVDIILDLQTRLEKLENDNSD